MNPKTSTLIFASMFSWLLVLLMVPSRSPRRLAAARHAAHRRRRIKEECAQQALRRAEVEEGQPKDLVRAVRWSLLGMYVDWHRWPVRQVLDEVPDVQNDDPEVEQATLPAPYPLLHGRDTARPVVLIWHWLRLVLYRWRWG